jgi:hypothetical protein
MSPRPRRSSRYVILARVVDYEGLSLLCGVHGHPLPPREAARVVGTGTHAAAPQRGGPQGPAARGADGPLPYRPLG